MLNRESLTELAAVLALVVVVVGLPLVIWWYEYIYRPRTLYPPGTKIIDLSAKVSQDKCLWTQERINGLNYWWKKFRFADNISGIKEGDNVVFRVRSADVLHSFAIPRFRIGPEEIEAGKVTEIAFEPTRRGSFRYLCWLWCSSCHGDLKGKIEVGQ
ncbi:MAG: hypothetical protein ACE5GG_04375 [Candidatus Omnitrophota bacterium]